MDIKRKGSNAALIFWGLCFLGCYVCVFALLYNHFYDSAPIIGLILISLLFVFFGFATRWSESLEFRKDEIYFIHTASLYKKREYHWKYEDVYVTNTESTSRQKNGNAYVTVTFYLVYLHSSKGKGGVELKTVTSKMAADQLEKFYTDFIRQKTVSPKATETKDAPSRPTW